MFESVYSPYVHENEDISAFGIQIVFVKKFCVKNRNVSFLNYNTLVMIPQQFIYEIYELRQLVEKWVYNYLLADLHAVTIRF